MRSVLAVDDLLAGAIKKKIAGRIDVFGHMEMRDSRGLILRKLRKMLDDGPSVLAIGGKKWDALTMLERLDLPQSIPVVLLAPRLTEDCFQRSTALRVFSIVPLDGAIGVSSAVVVEMQLARKWQQGLAPRSLVPVVVQCPRAASHDRPKAQVIALAPRSRVG